MSERVIKLSLEKAKEFYNKGGEFRDLALSAYTEEELTKTELPKTWEEFCKQNKTNENEYYLDNLSCIVKTEIDERHKCSDRNILPNKEAAEAHLALMQLHQLRDCYRQGWIPTLNKTSFGIIRRVEGDLEVEKFVFSSRFLSF